MKKFIKLFGITTAALLTVTPIVTSTTKADTVVTNASNENVNVANPVITYNGKSYDHDQTINNLVEDAPFNYRSLTDTSDIAPQIKKYFSATASSQDKTPVEIKVDLSKFNAVVAGKYPISVLAMNKAGKATRITFLLTVGDKNSNAKYAEAKPKYYGNVAVYQIKNGKVSHWGINLSNGTTVATFGTVNVGGISYTQLNSPDSDIYVETNSVNSVYPLKNSNGTTNYNNKRTTKILMHAAMAYDVMGKATHTKYPAFTKLVVSQGTDNKNGSLFYTHYGDGTVDYIKASNIDGTKRTLKKNAYIYSTSTRRTSFNGSWKLTKGSTVTTYGGSYKFKNGKRYYRIGGPAKQYVRTANF